MNIKKKIFKLLSIKIIFLSLLKLDTFLYKLISAIAVIKNKGIHPKHSIINYEKWFLDELDNTDIVLDIGCNTGGMAKILSRKVEFVYGIEIEKDHIKNANKFNAAENIQYICSDATTFDYSTLAKKISVITLSNVLEHIDERKKILDTLCQNVNIEHNLRFLIRVPLIERDWLAVYKKELNIDYRLDRTHVLEYTLDIFKEEMIKSNLKINYYKIKFGELYASCSLL